jgi:hypothetical protein
LATLDNVYMETGGWCEKQFEIAFEVGVTANHLTWGHDYGNVPNTSYAKMSKNTDPSKRLLNTVKPYH